MTTQIKYSILLPLSALALVACDEKDAPYVAPQEPSEVILTQALADSLWGEYASAYPYVEQVVTAPTSITDPYYEDYVDNWLVDGEETRDVTITFDGDQAQVTFDPDSKSKDQKFVKIEQQGAHLIIRNDSVTVAGEAAGRARMNYILRGASSDGSVRIYSNKKFMVTLDGLSLTNAHGPAISVQKSLDKKRMFLRLAEGSTNALCDAETYTDIVDGEDDKGCLFSEGKIILMGHGKLTITGNYNHALAADDRLHIQQGVQLTVIGNSKDGIHVKDEVVQSGGLVRVFGRKDAVQCDTLATGYLLRGGRLLTCGKRALTASPFSYQGGSFCQIGQVVKAPDNAVANVDTIQQKGYLLLESH